MLLAMDTAGPILAIGLFDGGRSVATFRQEVGRGHAERLLPAIRSLLDDAALKPSDLSRIAVVVGPGSFMGLRVAIATARSMALGLGIEAVGVSRMQALARGRGPIEILLDARRGEIFVSEFPDENEALEDDDGTSLFVVPVAAYEHRTQRVAGSGVALVRDRLDPRTKIVFEHDVPDLADVAALASEHPLPAKPIYGRGADAKKQQPPILSGVRQPSAAP